MIFFHNIDYRKLHRKLLSELRFIFRYTENVFQCFSSVYEVDNFTPVPQFFTQHFIEQLFQYLFFHDVDYKKSQVSRLPPHPPSIVVDPHMPHWGPHTQQPGGCGEAGIRIILTPLYLEEMMKEETINTVGIPSEWKKI